MPELTLGFDAFEKDLQKIIETVSDPDTIQEMLEVMAAPIVADAKKRVPVNDGRLRDGIVTDYSRKRPYEIKIGWSNKAFYGRFLEDGYHHIGKKNQFIKKPHLRPAYHAKIEEGKQNAIALFWLLNRN